MSHRKLSLFSVIALVVVGIIIGIIFVSSNSWTDKSLAEPQSAQVPAKDLSESFYAVSNTLLPTVVSISTSTIVEPRLSDYDQFFGPLLRDFFGRDLRREEPQPRERRGLGSGVIISNEGHIITNNHVIDGAQDITVTLNDKRNFDARLVGADPNTDIAVIKIDADDVPVAEFGNSENLRIGEWVLAIGNPLHLTSTVTAGIISAKGRNIGILRGRSTQEQPSYAIENFIQTDAAINPGNSGGALVDMNGEVIGINTAIASQTGGYMGYGFAVPSNLAKRVMQDLIEKGYVTRAWLGISMREVDETIARRFDMEKPMGVIIEQVMDDSPAQKAGLKPLDVILKLNDKDIDRSNQLQNQIALRDPGETVELTILRDGERKKLNVELGKRDNEEKQKQRKSGEASMLGLELRNLTDNIRSRLRHDYYDDTEGVIVTGVQPMSPAANAGIQAGDVIRKIEEETIEDVSNFKEILNEHKDQNVVILTVQRLGSSFHAFVDVTATE
ncbi:Do family serine endopeptidase [candidate division KSB1 bacterium]|nr:Do family serine endopeptidase [candidate division KSB1 bacterium]